MAQVEPVGGAPWVFMRRLEEALGPLGWYEAQWPARDLWYVNLIHFTGPVRAPEGLIDWVGKSRNIAPVDFVVDSVELVAFHLALAGVPAILPQTWARATLVGCSPTEHDSP